MKPVIRIGRWSIRRPKRALVLWLAVVVFAIAFGAATGTKTLDNGAVGESARGYSLMDTQRVGQPDREFALIQSKSAGTPQFRAAVRDARRRFAELGLNASAEISRDRRSAVVIGAFDRAVPIERVRRAVADVARAHPKLSIRQSGDISTDLARTRIVDKDLHRAELLSIPVTLLVLLFAFGALVAASVPVLLALTAVAAAFGLLGPLSQAFPLDDATKTVVFLIGMAVGVDYSLFYVTRSREERRRGLASHAALEVTARTSGRTVLVSGTTVMVAMAGLFIAGTDVFNGFAIGTIAVVACAIAGSVTVLPAALELLGSRIDRGRVPFLSRPGGDRGRFWSATIERVLRRPLLAVVASVGLLLLLAYPALSLHVSKPSDLSLAAQDDPALKTLVDARRAFPGGGEPAVVVVRAPASSRDRAALEISHLRRLALERGIAHQPVKITANENRTAAVLVLPLSGDGANPASRHAIAELRDVLIPATLGRVPGVETAVTGRVAEDVDFTRQISRSLPYVIAFVLVLAFFLLLVAFRSIVVPLKAIVLNLLSVGASYGVLVLVFQHQWAESILGFESNGTIISWLPLFLFVLLFGLSMDYHVFILSRVREAVDNGESTENAVRQAINATAGVITSAALVMIGVFALFGTLSSLELKQTGVGLAVAVLLDATLIRVVLLPASMTLLGEWNWYLPHALQRLSVHRPDAAIGGKEKSGRELARG